MKEKEQLPIMGFANLRAWEEWLAGHHAEPAGVWLKIAKKGVEPATLSYAEAVEGALCYGWIDGQKAGLDESYWLQKFTPRRAQSIWSQVNREKASALIEAGRMQPPGLRQVELAQADGRWEAAYPRQSSTEVPDDLQAALDDHPQARAFFQTLNSANRFAILFRVSTAKKPETRVARIQKCIAMLEKGEKFHP